MPLVTYRKTLIFFFLSIVFSLLHFTAEACESYIEIQEEICEGQSFSFNGEILSQSGIYYDTLLNISDCDSIVTLNLTVLPSLKTNLSPQICAGQSYVFAGQPLFIPGIYTHTFQSVNGCDSIVEIDLRVLQPNTYRYNVEICAGQSYTVGNHVYHTTGAYTDTFQLNTGCDSIVVTDLTVNPVTEINLTKSICTGQIFTVGNQSFTATGQYEIVLQSAAGCDSIIRLALTVNNVERTDLTKSICTGQSFTVGNQSFTATGQYEVVMQSATGCDSTVHLDLTVNNVIRTNLLKSICTGQSFTVGNQTFTATGQYEVILQSVSGCDSIVSLALTVQTGFQKNISESICAGQSFTVGNQNFTATGQYEVVLQSVSGCDSIISLQLTVNNPVVRNINATICQGKSFQLGTNVYQTSGNYTAVLTAANGCDSTVNLQLTVEPVSRTSLSPTICRGQAFQVGNKNHTNSGTYTDTLTNQFFCDSIITTILTVKEITTEQITRTICQGQSVVVGQNSYNQAGLYRDTLHSVFGCDSIVVLRLFVQNQLTSQQTVNICQGQTYSIGQSTYSQSGTYRDTLVSSGTCDSIVTTVLRVRPVFQQTFNREICPGDSIIFASGVIKTAGQYTHEFSSIYACDSTVTLNVTLLRRDSEIIERNSCQGKTLSIGGGNYNRDTTFLLNYTNTAGCDSIIEYRLKFYPVYQHNVQRNVCAGTVFQNILINKDTSVTLNLKSVHGCDSTVQVQITAIDKFLTENIANICYNTDYLGVRITKDTVITRVLSSQQGCDSIVVDTVLVLPGFQMSVSTDTTINPGNPVTLFASGATAYEWSTGATSASVVVRPNVTTVYTVTGFSVDGCEQKEGITVSVNSCQVTAPSYFTPNGDGAHDKWKAKGTECMSEFDLKIINRWGDVVYETEQASESWDGTFKGQPVPEGVYFYIIEGIAAQDRSAVRQNGYIHLER